MHGGWSGSTWPPARSLIIDRRFGLQKERKVRAAAAAAKLVPPPPTTTRYRQKYKGKGAGAAGARTEPSVI